MLSWIGVVFCLLAESLAEAHSALIPHGHPHGDGGSLTEGLGLTLIAVFAVIFMIRNRGPRHGW